MARWLLKFLLQRLLILIVLVVALGILPVASFWLCRSPLGGQVFFWAARPTSDLSKASTTSESLDFLWCKRVRRIFVRQQPVTDFQHAHNDEERNVKDRERPIPPARLDFAEIPDSKRDVPEDDGSQTRVIECLELPIVGDAVSQELTEPEYDGCQTDPDRRWEEHGIR